MSNAQSEIERLAHDIALNPALSEQFKALGQDYAAMAELANSKGYRFTLDEAKAMTAETGELSNEQLEQVAGGKYILIIHKGFSYS